MRHSIPTENTSGGEISNHHPNFDCESMSETKGGVLFIDDGWQVEGSEEKLYL